MAALPSAQIHPSARVHPSAVIEPGAVLGERVQVGPHALIGTGVTIGDGSEVGAGARVLGPTRIGRDNRIFPNACLGFEPQDLKFQGEEVHLEVGDRNQFREFCTVHRGTSKGGGVTRIGSDNLFMVYTHVAHDCQVGNRVVFANNATLAGHVEVLDDATISAFTSVHQFCRVGRHAYVGAYTVVVMDALPFVKTVGQKATCYGVNTIGLRRKGFEPEAVRRLEQAYRILVRSRLNTTQALARLRAELGGSSEHPEHPEHPEISELIAFVESAKRGVHKSPPERGQGGRGVAGQAEQPDLIETPEAEV
ncbi:MAG TPA: acyl-ACP--UDP-N-acetylglucosamine O-acyltransferase [Thermoanaerobaculia bacterium]|nr:acyl-ACP--UDP-N-acetylglucosamine O-acyltransferase [Thermoanaerobaculia bacterium]